VTTFVPDGHPVKIRSNLQCNMPGVLFEPLSQFLDSSLTLPPSQQRNWLMSQQVGANATRRAAIVATPWIGTTNLSTMLQSHIELNFRDNERKWRSPPTLLRDFPSTHQSSRNQRYPAFPLELELADHLHYLKSSLSCRSHSLRLH
jgi:hypothetical protein